MSKRRQTRILVLTAGLVLGAGLGLFAITAWLDWRREHSQDLHILAAAQRYGIDPALVKAVVWKESRFHPWARGRAGEIGLMQLMDAAAQEWAEGEHCYPLPPEHLFNPVTNILAGTWYLAKLLKRYRAADDPVAFALADYNAGRGNVLKWARGAAATDARAFVDAIGFPTTRIYVDQVRQRRRRYAGDFSSLALRSPPP